jgi:DNA polymerase-3 subunit epsilon
LGYLLNDYGLFHEGHRALDDCEALLEVLAQPLAPLNEVGPEELYVKTTDIR